MRAA
ncbi:EPSP synthase family protein, partial [Chlamydia psittaci 84-8471/1]|jgi:hypothetical protein